MVMEQLSPLGDAPLKEAPAVDPLVPGFRASAIASGLRPDGREDLALIAAKKAVPAAGVFTNNKLFAAPVAVCRENVSSGHARAILANSGGANAATGAAGLAACTSTCAAVAKALGCRPSQVLPCSTGVIGVVLDADKVNRAVPKLAAGLEPQGAAQAAGAIMTTDVFKKMARREALIDGKPVTVLGMAKGAGMIRPDMATMLCFLLTDAAATPAALAEVLGEAVELSFNRATVDGDTSTNDTALIMASGEAGNQEMDAGDPNLAWLTGAVTAVCQDLAAMMVADGEGASHLIRVRVVGASDSDQARAFCYAIAHSPLVKTAFAGGDPNWGRILSAAGAEAARAGLDYEPKLTTLSLGGVVVARGAAPEGGDAETRAAKAMAGPRYELILELGLGAGEHWLLTSDLTEDYVRLNADYRS
jgi:glutamate N-acetyltransferase / amino-acid N-acetyltransferase